MKVTVAHNDLYQFLKKKFKNIFALILASPQLKS